MTPIRPAIFDMDGTLIDSMDIITDTFDRTMREEAGIVHPREYYRRFVGPPLPNRLPNWASIPSIS